MATHSIPRSIQRVREIAPSRLLAKRHISDSVFSFVTGWGRGRTTFRQYRRLAQVLSGHFIVVVGTRTDSPAYTSAILLTFHYNCDYAEIVAMPQIYGREKTYGLIGRRKRAAMTDLIRQKTL